MEARMRRWPKGVKRVRAKGRTYYYHAKTGARLVGDPGSAAFLLRVQELDERASKTSQRGQTLGALIVAYRKSPEWEGHAVATRTYYQKVFDRLKPNEAVPLAAIDGAMLYELRDTLVRERKRSFTNATITVLRLLFTWGIKRGWTKENPATAVDMIARPRNAPIVNRPWSEAELVTVLQEFPDWLKVPIVLAAYTGLREQDLVRVTWACYDGVSFETRSHKTGVSTFVKAHYRLQTILDATPRRSPIIVTGARGRPLSMSGLRNSFYRYLAPLVAIGRVGRGLSIHGLRHMLGTELAETGSNESTIASVLGQKSTRMAAHYSSQADRRQLATVGIERLENRSRKTDRETGT